MDDIINIDTLKEIYEMHRKCVIKHSSGEIEEATDYNRMTLGFNKALKVVMAADLTTDHIVMNIFGGAGGILRLLSLRNPRLLIAIDKLYPGEIKSPQNWFYDTDNSFMYWEKDISNINKDIKIRRPVFCQYDILNNMPAFMNAIDRIIIDPPYGLVSEEALRMNENESKKVFLASIVSGLNYLIRNGKIISIIPLKWLEFLLTQVDNIKVDTIEEIRGKHNFVIIEITRTES